MCCCVVALIQIAENASLNAESVTSLNQQNLSKYSAGPCECCNHLNKDRPRFTIIIV